MTFINTTDESDTIPHLRLVIGGKQPPVKGGNWLSKLKQYTVFHANCPKITKVDCFHCQVWEKYANTTVLMMRINLTEQPIPKLVSNEGFSDDYILMEIIDDPGNRTDLERRLEANANIEPDHKVVEETGP